MRYTWAVLTLACERALSCSTQSGAALPLETASDGLVLVRLPERTWGAAPELSAATVEGLTGKNTTWHLPHTARPICMSVCVDSWDPWSHAWRAWWDIPCACTHMLHAWAAERNICSSCFCVSCAHGMQVGSVLGAWLFYVMRLGRLTRRPGLWIRSVS